MGDDDCPQLFCTLEGGGSGGGEGRKSKERKVERNSDVRRGRRMRGAGENIDGGGVGFYFTEGMAEET